METKLDVEKRFGSDSDFNELYEDLKNLVKGIQLHSQKEVLNQLKDFSKTLPLISSDTKASAPKMYLKVAAVLGFLMISSILYFVLRNQEVSPNELFVAYYEYYPNQITRSSRSELDLVSEKDNAYYAYEIQDYKNAIILLEKISEELDDGASIFYLGLSYLSSKNAEEAIPYFEKYLKSHRIFRNQAKWYLGLSYLTIFSEKEANKVLETIPRESSYYSKAQLVLKELKNGR